MAEKMKPDKLMLDVRQADAAGLSYGRWRFEETERIVKNRNPPAGNSVEGFRAFMVRFS